MTEILAVPPRQDFQHLAETKRRLEIACVSAKGLKIILLRTIPLQSTQLGNVAMAYPASIFCRGPMPVGNI